MFKINHLRDTKEVILALRKDCQSQRQSWKSSHSENSWNYESEWVLEGRIWKDKNKIKCDVCL